MREPMLVPLAAVAAGIFISGFVRFEWSELVLPLCALTLLAVVAFRCRLRVARALTLFLLGVLGGIAVDLLHRPSPPPTIDASPYETVIIEGCVVKPPIFLEDRARFVAELDPGARANVTIYVDEDASPPPLSYGQRIDITGRIRRPHNYQNPGAFDYETYLARQQIYWSISVSNPEDIKPLPGRCGTFFWDALYRLRTAALNRLDRLYADSPTERAMLRAILLGEPSQLEEDWKGSFQRTGAYHTLVISGLHLTVLAAGLLLLLRVSGLPFGWRIAIATAAAWMYAGITGCNTPVIRAATGLTLFLSASWFYRGRHLLNIVAVTALAFLLVDPGQLFDPSFHLSFLAVAMIGGIALPVLESSVSPYKRALSDINNADRDIHLPPRAAQFRVELRMLAETAAWWTGRTRRFFLQPVAIVLRVVCHLLELAIVSATIQFGLVLPMAVYFHRAPLVALPANLVIVPIVSMAVPAGFLALFTGSEHLASATGWLAMRSLDAARWFEGWEPGLRVPSPPVWLGGLFLALLCLTAWVLRRRIRLGWMVPLFAAMIAALVVAHPFPPHLPPGWLEITAIDVGQAESLFVALPDGRTMLVDGGGIPARGRRTKPALDIGDDVVSPYLWSRSIRKLDVVVSSHGHEDHIGGLFAVLENFRPRELWLSSTALDPASTALKSKARTLGITVVTLGAPREFSFGGVRVQVIAPPAVAARAWEAHNDDSLVLRLTYGRHSLLLTGDIGKRVERRIAGRLPPTTILKAPHHGSNTSSTPVLLDAIRPAFALISSGYQNPYRFPHSSVLRRFADRHVGVLRTDDQGLVTIRTDGRRITVDTYPAAGSQQ